MDPDRPIADVIEIQAVQLRQTAYLVGTFWRSLLDAGVPAHLADNLVQTWFEDAEAVEVETADRDDD